MIGQNRPGQRLHTYIGNSSFHLGCEEFRATLVLWVACRAVSVSGCTFLKILGDENGEVFGEDFADTLGECLGECFGDNKFPFFPLAVLCSCMMQKESQESENKMG